MAKGAYVGVDGIAHKIKKIYTGVDNVARKVKKGYVGVGGIARPFWGGLKEPEYYGTIDPLSVKRYALAATTVDRYALFGGGSEKTTTFSKTVDSYTNTLSRVTITDLSLARRDFTATTVGNYALFAGGKSDSFHKASTVDGYTNVITRVTVSSLSDGRDKLASTTVGNYALFAGGYSSNKGSLTALVDTISYTLTRGTANNLDEPKREFAATTVGNYALFAGGYKSPDYTTSVDGYFPSLSKFVMAPLSVARGLLGATTVGNYALFAGGTGYVDTIDVYDANGTKISSILKLSKGVRYVGATTLGSYALFAGGDSDPGISTTVDFFDINLVGSTSKASLNEERYLFGSTTVWNYALFGGGYSSGGTTHNVMDVFYSEGANEIKVNILCVDEDGKRVECSISPDPKEGGIISKDGSEVTLIKGTHYIFSRTDGVGAGTTEQHFTATTMDGVYNLLGYFSHSNSELFVNPKAPSIEEGYMLSVDI